MKACRCFVGRIVKSSVMILRSVVLSFGLVSLASAVDPVADFSLPDVNESSPRLGKEVSPRNYLHQVTAYYFGSST
jgi:hypothetical protein